jgi:phosphohistidine swiveling domain-containing protein
MLIPEPVLPFPTTARVDAPPEPLRLWSGRGASPGVAVGPARVIATDADLGRGGDGEVLVLRHARPAALGALRTCAAAVCETGGVLNHLAILARELGKPCVTELPGILGEVAPGARLRVDGVRGVVEALDGPAPPIPGGGTPPAPGAMTPLMQFGRFSGAFECVEAVFEPEAALRTAALVTLPVALGLGSPFPIDFDGNRILVATDALRALTGRLVERLDAAPGSAGAMRDRYDRLCGWRGWEPVAAAATWRPAVERFVALNQLTWGAALAKEPLAERLRESLAERVPGPAGEALFLEALAVEGQSFILGDGAAEGAHPLPARTLGRLEAALGTAGAERVVSRRRALADLVSLTERKHTDLARAAEALRRVPIPAALGLPAAGLVDDGSAANRRRIVERVVAALSSPNGGAPA